MKVPNGVDGPWPGSPTRVPADATALAGLWSRSLPRWNAEGYPDDTTTVVRWLQGDSWYIDLRQGSARPDFTGITRWDQLDSTQLRWMLDQDVFAGRLLTGWGDPGFLIWQRDIDWSPAVGEIDCGTIYLERA